MNLLTGASLLALAKSIYYRRHIGVREDPRDEVERFLESELDLDSKRNQTCLIQCIEFGSFKGIGRSNFATFSVAMILVTWTLWENYFPV